MNTYEFRTKLIKQIVDHKKLYEGLIQTYPVKSTIHGLSTLMKVHNLKIKYNSVGNSSNKTLSHIHIMFNIYNSIDGDLIVNFFNKCGWQLGLVIDKKTEVFKDSNKLLNYNSIKDIYKFIFRAKFEMEISKKDYPEYLYHITPKIYLNKILKTGLKPKGLSKLFNHKPGIYLFDFISEENTLDLVKELDAKRNKTENTIYNNIYNTTYINTYYILKIEVPNHDLFKLFIDPDLPNGYFTLDNIHPLCIKNVEEIII